MTSGRSTRAAYLGEPPDATFAVLHPAGEPSPVAVVLCPPFGWEEMTSYRPRRAWAEHLAGHGIPCVRLSYPGTGDSGGGPRDPRRIGAWSDAIVHAADYVRAQTGARSVIAVGLGLGGLLACHAASRGSSIDGLVGWAMPTRGREVVRQLRAFARIERSTFWSTEQPRSALAEGELEAGGYVLSAQTIDELGALDIESMDLDGALPAGALLLERDGIAVDERLVERLREAGVEVTVSPGDGWAQMTAHPQTAELSAPVIDAVTHWLQDRPASSGARSPAPAVPADETMPVGATGAVERPITIDVGGTLLRGVRTIPEPIHSPFAVVFLNAGAQRRVGPNRMWVEASRRWAALGVPSVRLDIEGIGDSDGELTPYRENGELNSQACVAQVGAALRELRAGGVAERFMLIGLCGGAYWAFHLLLDAPEVRAAVAINPFALVWAEELAPARDLRRVFADRSWALIRKNATPERVRALLRWLILAPWRRTRALISRGDGRAHEPSAQELLDQALSCGKHLTFVFSERERLLDEFTRTGRLDDLERSATVSVHALEVNDHTLRPSWAQREVHRILDGALERELGSLPEPAAGRSSQAAGV